MAHSSPSHGSPRGAQGTQTWEAPQKGPSSSPLRGAQGTPAAAPKAASPQEAKAAAPAGSAPQITTVKSLSKLLKLSGKRGSAASASAETDVDSHASPAEPVSSTSAGRKHLQRKPTRSGTSRRAKTRNHSGRRSPVDALDPTFSLSAKSLKGDYESAQKFSLSSKSLKGDELAEEDDSPILRRPRRSCDGKDSHLERAMDAPEAATNGRHAPSHLRVVTVHPGAGMEEEPFGPETEDSANATPARNSCSEKKIVLRDPIWEGITFRAAAKVSEDAHDADSEQRQQEKVGDDTAQASPAGCKVAGAGRGVSLIPRQMMFLQSHLARVAPCSMNVLGLRFSEIHRSYFLGAVLGSGQFGVIRLAERIRTKEQHACKTISKRSFKCKRDVEDVKREHTILKLLSSLKHVPRLVDTFEDQQEIHFVMELCQGGDLFDRLKRKKRYAEGEAATVVHTVLEVLKYCHDRLLVHRDIKPENVLLCSKDSDVAVKVIDFGIAAFMSSESEQLTEMMGSLTYMAPEVIGGSYGCAADMWSVGVMLYVLLTGRPPFWAKSEEGTIEAIKEGAIRYSKADNISDAARELIQLMLTRDPAQRITAAQALENRWIVASRQH